MRIYQLCQIQDKILVIEYSNVHEVILVQIITSRLVGAKPLSEPMLEYC